MTTAELAWLAGIIEGEGSIFLRYSGKNSTGERNVPSIKVAMNDEDVVQRVHSLTGIGTVCTVKNRSGTTGYLWQCSKRDSVPSLLKNLYLWMGARRRAQIDFVLSQAKDYGWDGTRRSQPESWVR